jgi:hypothetical protein
MRKLATLPVALALLTILFATPAHAASTVAVTMAFSEPVATAFTEGCPVAPDGFCGVGQVSPYGRATETIDFFAGCGGGCDLRVVTLPQGTIVIEETFSDPACPGSCNGGPALPASGSLTDIVVGGTGIFVGATGALAGTVRVAARESQVRLSGTVTLST